jgi:ribosomal protein S18 acetylase RimI-like enzyme
VDCAICGADAWYVCGRSGRPVCPEHSRIEVVSRLSFGSSDGLSVRAALPEDSEEIGNLAEYFWGKTEVCCLDKDYDVLKLPAYVVVAGNNIAGMLSYSVEPDSLAVVMLDVLPGYQGLGAGRMLLDMLKDKAPADKKKVILAWATNDDLTGLYFYQKNGFQIYEVMPNRVAERGGGLLVGFAGIPCRDEIRLRFDV